MLQNLLNLLQDPWVLFGFLAQAIFFARFIVQWLASEKAKRSVLPIGFWYLSIIGGVMILIYSVQRQDPVFSTASALSLLMYLRNLVLSAKASAKSEGGENSPTLPAA